MTEEEMLYDTHIALLEDIWGEASIARGPDEVARVLEGLDLSGKTVRHGRPARLPCCWRGTMGRVGGRDRRRG